MKKITKIAGALFAALLISSAASCSGFDVVGADSTRAFDEILSEAKPRAIDRPAGPAWSLDAPDGTASFVIFRDENDASDFDIALEIDARPFIEAGLVPEKLAGWNLRDGRLVYRLNLDKSAPTGTASPLEVYKQIVKNRRDIIGYHAALDHYGITLGSGNMFEWAKNVRTNDKDVVFVLNPRPFIDAGTDPSAVLGWAFTKVPVDDENGKPILTDKILKPFNLL